MTLPTWVIPALRLLQRVLNSIWPKDRDGKPKQ